MTEDSLTCGATEDEIHTVRWNEARLFALAAGGKREGQATAYILATSPIKAVRWRHLSRPNLLSTREPTIPYEEYAQQMDALLSVVAARTGLPLYNLREWRTRANTVPTPERG